MNVVCHPAVAYLLLVRCFCHAHIFGRHCRSGSSLPQQLRRWRSARPASGTMSVIPGSRTACSSALGDFLHSAPSRYIFASTPIIRFARSRTTYPRTIRLSEDSGSPAATFFTSANPLSIATGFSRTIRSTFGESRASRLTSCTFASILAEFLEPFNV